MEATKISLFLFQNDYLEAEDKATTRLKLICLLTEKLNQNSYIRYK
jgi:hypothetical protein